MMKYLTRPKESEYEQVAMAGSFIKGGKKVIDKLIKKGKVKKGEASKTDLKKVRARVQKDREALLELAKNEQIPVEQIDKLLSGEIAQVKRTAGRGVIKLDKDGNPYVTETFTAKIKKEQIPGDDLPPPGSRGGEDDIAAPVMNYGDEGSEKLLKELEVPEPFAGKFEEEFVAHDNMFGRRSGDNKVDAQEIAEQVAEARGQDYYDLPYTEQMDLYDKAYNYLGLLDRTKDAMKEATGRTLQAEGGVIGGGIIEGDDLGSRTGFKAPYGTRFTQDMKKKVVELAKQGKSPEFIMKQPEFQGVNNARTKIIAVINQSPKVPKKYKYISDARGQGFTFGQFSQIQQDVINDFNKQEIKNIAEIGRDRFPQMRAEAANREVRRILQEAGVREIPKPTKPKLGPKTEQQLERDVRKEKLKTVSDPSLERSLTGTKNIEFHHADSKNLNAKILTTANRTGYISKDDNKLIRTGDALIDKYYEDRAALLKKKPKGGKALKQWQKDWEAINKKGMNTVANPKYKGLLNFKVIDPVTFEVRDTGLDESKMLMRTPDPDIPGLYNQDDTLATKPFKEMSIQEKRQVRNIADKKLKNLLNPPTENILKDVVGGKQLSANPFMQMLRVGAPTLPAIFGPTGIAGLTYALRPEGGYDLSRPEDRLTFELEAALAPATVKGTSKAASYLAGGNQPLRRGLERAINLGMRAAPALRVARALSPLGLLSLAGEAGYYTYKKAQETQAAINAMTPHQRELYESQMAGEALMGEAEFADGGRVGFEKGGSSSDKKKTPLDKPTVQIDPNAPVDPAKRDTLKGAGILGAGVALGKLGLLKLGKTAKVAKAAKVAPLTKVVAPLGKTMTQFPEWFPTLINKARKEGTRTPIYGNKQVKLTEAEYNKLSKEEAKDFYDTHYGRSKEYIQELKEKGEPRYSKWEKTDEIIGYEYKLKDRPDLKISEYSGEDIYVEFPNAYGQPVEMSYTAPKGTKDATFQVDDAIPEMGWPDEHHVDFYAETVNNLDEVYGGASDLEQYVLKTKKPRTTQGDEVVARADAKYDYIKDTAEDFDEF